MSLFKNTARLAAMSIAATTLTVSLVSADEIKSADGGKSVFAKLLILPAGNIPSGMSDLDRAARGVSFDGALEGSSSYNGQSDQNSRSDILGDAGLEKATLGISKSRKPANIRRKAVKSKKQRVKVARISIPTQTFKRRAPLILGVYR